MSQYLSQETCNQIRSIVDRNNLGRIKVYASDKYPASFSIQHTSIPLSGKVYFLDKINNNIIETTMSKISGSLRDRGDYSTVRLESVITNSVNVFR